MEVEVEVEVEVEGVGSWVGMGVGGGGGPKVSPLFPLTVREIDQTLLSPRCVPDKVGSGFPL